MAMMATAGFAVVVGNAMWIFNEMFPVHSQEACDLKQLLSRRQSFVEHFQVLGLEDDFIVPVSCLLPCCVNDSAFIASRLLRCRKAPVSGVSPQQREGSLFPTPFCPCVSQYFSAQVCVSGGRGGLFIAQSVLY